LALNTDVFEEVIFSSNIIETPESSGDGACEKKERRKKKISKTLFK
jgi:hypothetical protein